MDKLDNYRIMGAVYSHETLTAHQRSVLLNLLWHRDRESGKCCPGYKRIAKETGISRSSVERAVRWLLRNKVIIRVEMTGVCDAQSHYVFAVDAQHLSALPDAAYREVMGDWFEVSSRRR